MNQYFYRAAAVVFGLLFVVAGRWMFFHPEKALKKSYSDLISPTKFTSTYFRIFGIVCIVGGLWAACTACVPSNLWDRYGLVTGIVLIVVVVTCTFLLLRGSDSSWLAHSPKR